MTFATAVLIAAGTYLGAVIGWQIMKEVRRQWLLRRSYRIVAKDLSRLPWELQPPPPTDKWLRANSWRFVGTNPDQPSTRPPPPPNPPAP